MTDATEPVKYHISKKLVDKITLDELAWIVGMNKYKFIRWFKENVGLTPFDYIIINRIEEGIKMIKEGKPLAHIAIDTGFYDQSNFSNYFKRYVGVTPKSYKENCNIFQDIRHN